MPPDTIRKRKPIKKRMWDVRPAMVPGEKYQEMMTGADALEGGKIARENGLKSCTRCHHPHIGKEEHIDLARKGLASLPIVKKKDK